MNFRLMFLFSAVFGIALQIVVPNSFAETDLGNRLSAMIKKTLEEKITRAEVEVPALDSVIENSAIKNFENITQVRLLDDKANGVAILEVSGENSETQVIQTPYTAWIKAPVATRRIYPNSKIKAEDIRIQSINVASGPAREYRGVLAAADTNFANMESRQTILEGQFVTTSAIQKQPDIRKGEMVKLELNSGDLSLSTQAISEESASVGDKIRVMTLKSKKEILGKVKEDHSVEVNL